MSDYSALALAEDLIKSSSGGVFTNDSKFDEPDYIIFILDQFRAAALFDLYNSKTRPRELHYSLMQTYRVDKETIDQIQDPITGKYCGVRFEVPKVLMLNSLFDGFGYIGSATGRSSFKRVKSRNHLSDLLNHSQAKKKKFVLTDSDNMVEVYGYDGIDELMVTAAFDSPTLLPDFDINASIYPMNNALMARMKELMNKITLNYMAMTPSDRIQDFQYQLSKMKQQIVIK